MPRTLSSFLLLLLFLPLPSYAFTYTVSKVAGPEAYSRGEGSSHRQPLQAGAVLQEGESVQTGARTVVFLLASNGHKIHLAPNSQLALRLAGKGKGIKHNVVELLEGSARALVEKSDVSGDGSATVFVLKHRSVSIGVRGTDFLTVAGGEGLEVFLNEGKLFLQEKKELLAGNSAVISAGGEIVRTASMTRFEFARAIERSGFGSENEDAYDKGSPKGGGGGSGKSPGEAIRGGNVAGLKALQLSKSELSDLGNGESALHLAAKSGHAEMLSYLLQQGLDVNVQDPDGKTPLMLAIERKHLPSVKMLLAHGADRNKRDNKNRSAHDYARQSENREIQNLLAKD